MIGGALQTLGALLLVHSAVSTVHYREYAKGLGHVLAANHVPSDVVAEVALAFVLVLLGALASAGPLKRADAVGKDSATSSLDAFFSRPDFQVFNHRMRAFRSRFARARGEKE